MYGSARETSNSEKTRNILHATQFFVKYEITVRTLHGRTSRARRFFSPTTQAVVDAHGWRESTSEVWRNTHHFSDRMTKPVKGGLARIRFSEIIINEKVYLHKTIGQVRKTLLFYDLTHFRVTITAVRTSIITCIIIIITCIIYIYIYMQMLSSHLQVTLRPTDVVIVNTRVVIYTFSIFFFSNIKY